MAELEQVEAVGDPIGVRLRTAREAQGLTLDDIAAKTRVPIRHLVHIEKGEWDQLPAPTYSVGFARAYATAVGLDSSEIGAELRSQLSDTQAPVPSYYEPADPARVPPRWLALVAGLIAILLIGGYFVWRSNTLGDEDEQITQVETASTPAAPPQPQPGSPAAPMPAGAAGPVVITATDDVWLRVYEAGGPKLFERILKAGERFEVPASAKRPQLLTGRPNALQVTVGSTPIPPLGPAEKTVADVSLLPADLLARNVAAPPVPPPTAPAAATAPAPPSARAATPPPPPRRAAPKATASEPSPAPAPTPAPEAPAPTTP
jgi:cytoskeletal protein RodZ